MKITKKDLVPFKHVLVTRKNDAYWYVGEDFDNSLYVNKNDKPKCYIGIHTSSYGAENYSNDSRIWNNNLNASWDKNSPWHSLFGDSHVRDNDIEKVYEVTDTVKWLEYLLKLDDDEDFDINELGYPYSHTKLIYERNYNDNWEKDKDYDEYDVIDKRIKRKGLILGQQWNLEFAEKIKKITDEVNCTIKIDSISENGYVMVKLLYDEIFENKVLELTMGL